MSSRLDFGKVVSFTDDELTAVSTALISKQQEIAQHVESAEKYLTDDSLNYWWERSVTYQQAQDAIKQTPYNFLR